MSLQAGEGTNVINGRIGQHGVGNWEGTHLPEQQAEPPNSIPAIKKKGRQGRARNQIPAVCVCGRQARQEKAKGHGGRHGEGRHRSWAREPASNSKGGRGSVWGKGKAQMGEPRARGKGKGNTQMNTPKGRTGTGRERW